MSFPKTGVEQGVCRDLQAYLQTHEPGQYSVSDEAGGRLSSSLSRLIEDCLSADHAFEWKGCWSDGLLEERITVRSPTHLEIAGLMMWGPGGKSWMEWMAPFEAVLEFGSVDESMRYSFRFGRKTPEGGLIRFPLSDSAKDRDAALRDRPREPEDWWYSCEGPK